jgi:hypothetical protein
MSTMLATITISREASWFDRWAPSICIVLLALIVAGWLFMTIRSMHEQWTSTRQDTAAKPRGFEVIRKPARRSNVR